MVSDVNISTALQQQANTSASTSKLAADFTQFLTLLTVQLQNQDPMSPMDTTEFTNQLVAFTGVEQQINTNQKLDSLVSLQIGTAFSAAQSYVGNDISYVSSEFSYTGEPSTLRYSLNGAAVTSKINILNEAGDVVYSTEASKSSGAHEFVWNGETNSGLPAVPGTYEITVAALDANDEQVTTSTVVQGRVKGVESQGGSIYLLVGERAVSLGNVLNTVEGTSSKTADALTSALSYVGMNVTYLNDTVEYNGTNPVNIIYNLERSADRAKLFVTDAAGNNVFIGDVDTDSGDNITTWNGRRTDGTVAPAGTYYFSIDAIDDNDLRVPYKSLTSGVVTGVGSSNGKIQLNIGSKSISISDIVGANVVPPATPET